MSFSNFGFNWLSTGMYSVREEAHKPVDLKEDSERTINTDRTRRSVFDVFPPINVKIVPKELSLDDIWVLRHSDPKSAAIEFARFIKKNPSCLKLESNRSEKQIQFRPIKPSKKELSKGRLPFTVITVDVKHQYILLNTNNQGISFTFERTSTVEKDRLAYDIHNETFVTVSKRLSCDGDLNNDEVLMKMIPRYKVDVAYSLNKKGEQTVYLFRPVIKQSLAAYFTENLESKDITTRAIDRIRLFKVMVDRVLDMHKAGVVHHNIGFGSFFFNDAGLELRGLKEATLGSAKKKHTMDIYKAPESFVDDYMSNEKTDIWAMGCLLYCFIFGEQVETYGPGPRSRFSVCSKRELISDLDRVSTLYFTNGILDSFEKREADMLMTVLHGCLIKNINNRFDSKSLSSSLEAVITIYNARSIFE
jgi:hypothetical protein